MSEPSLPPPDDESLHDRDIRHQWLWAHGRSEEVVAEIIKPYLVRCVTLFEEAGIVVRLPVFDPAGGLRKFSGELSVAANAVELHIQDNEPSERVAAALEVLRALWSMAYSSWQDNRAAPAAVRAWWAARTILAHGAVMDQGASRDLLKEADADV